ncbi:hypothetical protein ACOWON_03070 [Helicobacter pylori]
MAEWKTDTEEVRQIVKACRDFKRSLQGERCVQFIKNLDKYARETLLEHRKIEHRLQEAREGLRKAKKKKGGFLGFIRDAVNTFSSVFPPIKPIGDLALEALGLASKKMEENTEKYEKNVRLLEQVL